ncbi:SRPBCC family protein [Streptomyces sp. NPDC054952]
MDAVLTAVIDIDATPEEVWNVLTDFATYGEWSKQPREPLNWEARPGADGPSVAHLARSGLSARSGMDVPQAPPRASAPREPGGVHARPGRAAYDALVVLVGEERVGA